MAVPNKLQLKQLFEDAVSHNKERYGSIGRVEGTTAYTTTGITVALNWNELKFTQKGVDREIISLLYKVHYYAKT